MLKTLFSKVNDIFQYFYKWVEFMCAYVIQNYVIQNKYCFKKKKQKQVYSFNNSVLKNY